VLLPGKGRGLVASRSVEAGELLMVSRALFLAPADQIQQLAVSWILEATPRKKQQFYSLFDGTNGHLLPSLDLYRPGRDEEPAPGRLPDRLHPDRIYKILALNGFQADKFHAASATDPGRAKELLRPNEEEPGTAVSGLWAVPSLMNHACVPSTLTVPLSRATLAFVAAHSIEPGEEITFRYCTLMMPVELRRTELRRQKGFDCQCKRCTLEAEAVLAELAQRLLHVQQRAAKLELKPEDFLAALDEVAAVTRREISSCASRWAAATPGADAACVTEALLASYASVFVARAMATEQAAGPSRCFEAWDEVCKILQKVEPCSPNHLHAAFQRFLAASPAAAPEALDQVWSAWLGRHGVLQVSDHADWSASVQRLTRFGGPERSAALDAFLAAMSPPEKGHGPNTSLATAERVSAALQILQSHGWTLRAPPKEADAEAQVSPSRPESRPCEPGLCQWKRKGDGWQLLIFGYGADAKVDVASATLRLAPGPEAAARGREEMEVDLLQVLPAPVDPAAVKARMVRAGGDTALRIDFPCQTLSGEERKRESAVLE
ncbi:unnamed protein product, partial [Symbiodinium microadriaticum]